MTVNVIPWVLAGVAAIWFSLLAVKTDKNWALWGLAGGLFGLVTSTFVFGLGHAMATPFSDRERATLHLEWALVAIAFVVVVGGLFTLTVCHKPSSPAPERPQPAVGGEKKAGKAAP